LIIQFLIVTSSNFAQSKLQKNVEIISTYIIEANKNSKTVYEQLDSIYSFALRINNFDISETLLSLTFATIPYNSIPITTPILGIKINYPIVSADEEIFQYKNNSLPKYLFIDSPQTDFGDKDKLAHFFGSAFVRYNSLFFDLTPLIGYFVEVFEESFVMNASIDERDLMVNKLGSKFGGELIQDKNQMPSKQFLFYSFNKLMITTCLAF
jgi:uncharacterized protein YfkK (UPF0435 family)